MIEWNGKFHFEINENKGVLFPPTRVHGPPKFYPQDSVGVRGPWAKNLWGEDK